MTKFEQINLEIDKQVNAGFQPFEIRQNLLGLQFTEEEINDVFHKRNIDATKTEAPKRSSGSHVLSLLISVFFIISGSMRMSSNRSGSFLSNWGMILVIVGVVGVIWKTVDMVRSSQR